MEVLLSYVLIEQLYQILTLPKIIQTIIKLYNYIYIYVSRLGVEKK